MVTTQNCLSISEEIVHVFQTSFKPHSVSHYDNVSYKDNFWRLSKEGFCEKDNQAFSLKIKSHLLHRQQNWRRIYKYKQRVEKKTIIRKKSHLKRYKISQSLFDSYTPIWRTAVVPVLLQCNVDGGESVHSPAGVLLTGGKHSLHERLYKLWEPAFDNALSHRVHQGELQRETFDESK